MQNKLKTQIFFFLFFFTVHNPVYGSPGKWKRKWWLFFNFGVSSSNVCFCGTYFSQKRLSSALLYELYRNKSPFALCILIT